MEDEVKKYDTYKTCTNVFYFDGAGNLQKIGRRLCALYPRYYVFHGGEHVISLFFSGVAKLTHYYIFPYIMTLFDSLILSDFNYFSRI